MSPKNIITVGNFDGVHLGHQAIVRAARERAGPIDGCGVLAVTFDPPPIAVLKPRGAPLQVASLADRERWLRAAGADRVEVLTPDPAMLGLSAQAFIERLVADHGAVGFVEGEDFRFGKGRGGDMAVLRAMGDAHGFAVHTLGRLEAPLSDGTNAPVSSSLVRGLIGRGRVEDTAVCLGRPWEVTGLVVKGEQRGRTINIPTANLDPACYTGLVVPMDGVYAGAATLDDGTLYPAAISVGNKPTFGGQVQTIEAHLVGFTPDNPDALYGRPMTLRFARWVREQYPFANADELVTQLRRDIDQAQAWHRDAARQPS
ncbi:bifunctional riboflavin kinase/FMN adenylyltransferase [Phycisphaeraceae bacterium D3-23]